MSTETNYSDEVERLYEFGERLNEANDKSQQVGDYEGILRAVKGGSCKAKELAAQLIPRFFKYFPALTNSAITALFDLLEDPELRVRVQAIRALPLLCKDKPEFVSKITDILAQLLICEEYVERDAVHKAIMSMLRQDARASLMALFKHIENENVREYVISFMKEKVFPLKVELFKPQEELERHFTDLAKKSLQDVTGVEFKLFMDFLKTFKIFGDDAAAGCMQELVGMIEGQADLDAQFDVSDTDHIDRLISCIYMALPFFMRGASSSKFLNYLNKHIFPVFDKFPEERKLDLLKTLAGSSPYATAQDSRQLLPAIVELLKKYMPLRKTEEANFNYVECLLYTFHHLAHKTPNSTNSLCGYKIVTGQPSDRLGEDFSSNYKDFTDRLKCVEEMVKVAMKKLTQGMSGHNKALSNAKTEEAKAKIKAEQQSSKSGLRICNNIIQMIEPLYAKAPSFIGDAKVRLSWQEPLNASQSSATTAASGKRSTSDANGSNMNVAKKGRSDTNMQNQNRGYENLGRGGRSSWRGRGWAGRGRGRGYRR